MVAHCGYVRSDNSLQACSLEEKSTVSNNSLLSAVFCRLYQAPKSSKTQYLLLFYLKYLIKDKIVFKPPYENHRIEVGDSLQLKNDFYKRGNCYIINKMSYLPTSMIIT